MYDFFSNNTENGIFYHFVGNIITFYIDENGNYSIKINTEEFILQFPTDLKRDENFKMATTSHRAIPRINLSSGTKME